MTILTTDSTFSDRIITWFQQFGRKNLPWQQQVTPYRVWLSEVMLQQTQVTTAIPYYHNFLAHFPTIELLAKASVDDVLAQWAGLGYYARARNMHKTAQIIMRDYDGQFPSNIDELVALPGIGRSTAAAVLTFSMQQAHAILDGNVKRVLARHFEVEGWPGKASVLKQLWQLSEQLTPAMQTASYNQAMMDIGATICTRSKPKCGQCCLKETCLAYKNDRWKLYPGSKPKKQNPTKQAYLVLFKSDDSIYLEKRPPSGIWGGLWSLPEFETELLAVDWVTQFTQHMDILPNAKQHKFSHYNLTIHLVIANIQEMKGMVNDTESVRVNQQELHRYGLPTPVKALINQHGF